MELLAQNFNNQVGTSESPTWNRIRQKYFALASDLLTVNLMTFLLCNDLNIWAISSPIISLSLLCARWDSDRYWINSLAPDWRNNYFHSRTMWKDESHMDCRFMVISRKVTKTLLKSFKDFRFLIRHLEDVLRSTLQRATNKLKSKFA